MVGEPAPRSRIGQPVAALNLPGKVQVTAITRFGSTIIPEAKTVVQDGDFLHLAVARSALVELERHLEGAPAEEARR